MRVGVADYHARRSGYRPGLFLPFGSHLQALAARHALGGVVARLPLQPDAALIDEMADGGPGRAKAGLEHGGNCAPYFTAPDNEGLLSAITPFFSQRT